MADSRYTPGAEKKSILLVAVISAFLTPFMGSAINIALPAIGREFESSAILLSWIATAYLLSSAVFLVPFGRLADIYGRKKIFLSGMVIFTTASLLSAFSTSISTLLVFRIFQGMGSSMIFATGLAIVSSVFPPEERGRAFGLTIASVYIGLSIGPFAGGLMTEYLGWRSIFIFTVLLGITGIVFLVHKIKGEWAESKGESFDLAGSVIYGVSLFLLIFGLSRLPSSEGLVCLVAMGMAVTTIGLFMIVFINNMSILSLILTLILLGIGFGLFSSPNSNAIMSAVDKKYYGIASGTMGTMRLLGQMFSMGIVMLILSVFIGSDPVTEDNTYLFVNSIRVTFLLFSLLCFAGIFASMARGNIRIHKQ